MTNPSLQLFARLYAATDLSPASEVAGEQVVPLAKRRDAEVMPHVFTDGLRS